jgi:hypothetical protein
MVFCPVVTVVMLESEVAQFTHLATRLVAQVTSSSQCTHLATRLVAQATSPSQCTHLATRLSSITTATTGQKTARSETQSDLLMMGVKTPETC